MSIDKISQPEILVQVDYYDAQERTKLLQYPVEAVKAMEKLVGSPVAVPTSEFLTYFLFHRMGRGLLGYESVDRIQEDLMRATLYIDRCIEFDGRSIRLPSASAKPPNEIIEHAGEAIGLAVASRIHDLIEADWVRLPVGKHPANLTLLPSFDFQASDSRRIVQAETLIQVETKGSAVGNNRMKEPNVSIHKTNIHKKKSKLANLPAGEVDPYPAAVRYGTVTALDGNSIVQCWLVDPDPEGEYVDPRRFRLMTRMRFISQWISIVSPRSQLAAALATRVNDMANLSDPFELSGMPLLRGNGEPLTYPLTGPFSLHSTFFANKTRVTDGPAGGIAVPVGNNNLALLGIRQDLVGLAIEQDFDRVLTYNAPAGTLEKTVEFVFPTRKFRAMQLPPTIVNAAHQSGGYMRFTLNGSTQYNHSGLVFGFYRMTG